MVRERSDLWYHKRMIPFPRKDGMTCECHPNQNILTETLITKNDPLFVVGKLYALPLGSIYTNLERFNLGMFLYTSIVCRYIAHTGNGDIQLV